jgi:tetratricopeptide (TPR) repeat protein
MKMTLPPELPEDLNNLFDDYLDGTLDAARLRELEDRLRADPEARGLFVRYCRMDTDLHLEGCARQAGQRALLTIDQLAQAGVLPEIKRRWAIAAYRKALEIDPKNAPAYYNLGVALGRKNQPDAAIAAFSKALEIDPKNAPAYYNLGVALGEKNQ